MSCILLVTVSLATSEPAEEVYDTVWHRKYWKEETRELNGTPWYVNYRVLSGVVGVLALLVVISFW